MQVMATHGTDATAIAFARRVVSDGRIRPIEVGFRI
jgi:hypothetical protein